PRRVAAITACCPKLHPAYNVTSLYRSGLKSFVSAAKTNMLGYAEEAVGGGAESMSRGPNILPAMRWGGRLGDGAALDYMNGILHDPWKRMHKIGRASCRERV